MHSFLLLPRKLESKIIPLKHLSQECIPSSTFKWWRIDEEVMHINEIRCCSEPFSFHSKKQLLHNWERKRDVLRENLHSGKEKISTAIAHYPALPAWNSNHEKIGNVCDESLKDVFARFRTVAQCLRRMDWSACSTYRKRVSQGLLEHCVSLLAFTKN